MKTILCERLGIELPIIQAPMGGAVGPALAAAVSNAGGLGMLVLWRADTETMRQQIREMRALTSRPFGVNLNLDFPQEERLEICLEERVPVISFFWRDPSSLVPRAKAGGAIVMHSVGTAIDAKRAVDCGVDIVIAQGWEAGGHVRGMVATMPLVPAVVDAVSPTPVVCRRWNSGWARPRCGPRRRSTIQPAAAAKASPRPSRKFMKPRWKTPLYASVPDASGQYENSPNTARL
jgi:NAD(P)H-dependent flavin oxidoreductase YrpB (nitropropane dioxygenase family)